MVVSSEAPIALKRRGFIKNQVAGRTPDLKSTYIIYNATMRLVVTGWRPTGK